MTTGDDGSKPPRTAQEKTVAATIAELYGALRDVHADFSRLGQCREQTRVELQNACADVAMVLRSKRDEQSIDWEEATPYDRGPDGLLLDIRNGEVREVLPDDQLTPEPVKQQVPAKIPEETLYECALDLLDLADDMGLSYEAEINLPAITADTELTAPGGE